MSVGMIETEREGGGEGGGWLCFLERLDVEEWMCSHCRHFS